jgi:(1->4)-alpha-D-glucan 1-alpha-D-glucosylmutase
MRDAVARRRSLPESTYRLQFHKGFTFRDATAILPYLRELGITHVYASPYLKAKAGSTHGYDVIDHHALNPEIGTQADYDAFLTALKSNDLAHILDTVPNHVGVATNDNAWWNDVLEHGPASPFAKYFDVSWRGSPRPELHDKVLLPLLGKSYAQALDGCELQLRFEQGRFAVYYHDRRFPIAPRTYSKVLSEGQDEFERSLQSDSQSLGEYRELLTLADDLPEQSESGTTEVEQTHREADSLKTRLAALARRSPAVLRFIEKNVAKFNGVPGKPDSFDLLDDLLMSQSYRLAYWRIAPDEINYRRFFDINDLAALSVERQEVFDSTHELILQWLGRGTLQGLRIDHPDGLCDPKQYLHRLQQAYLLAVARAGGIALDPPQARALASQFSEEQPTGWPLYVTVEKILALDEPLPADWAVHGTSGYDFLDMVNGLFVQSKNEPAFSRIYQMLVPGGPSFDDLVYEKKRLILRIALASELRMLAHRLDRLAQLDRHSSDFTQNGLREALGEVIACFPVYRSYVSAEGVREDDRKYVNEAVDKAIARNPSIEPSVFHFIRDMVLLKPSRFFSEKDRADQLRFAGKFQQLTAPVTAKGIEDTAFYIYNRLISLNEVGGDPSQFGIGADALHDYLADRQARWPFALSPLSTHDTKRSEDVRARINVLSEIPDQWEERILAWQRINLPHRPAIGGTGGPDANDEYLLYQTLIGAFPLGPYEPQHESFVARLQAYMEKAIREAKVHTSWTRPNESYEKAVKDFVAAILKPGSEFLADFIPFQANVSHWGMLNSLSQTLIRLTAPGVPDTYQGTELWDFSLVDPDNRRPVDYELRRRMLLELKGDFESASDRAGFARQLLNPADAGRAKLLVIWRTLQQRRSDPGLFTAGKYQPLRAAGPRAERMFAFARSIGQRSAIIIAPRLVTEIASDRVRLSSSDLWKDTHLPVPARPPTGHLVNMFTGEAVHQDQTGRLSLSDALKNFPVALLVA